MLDSWDFLGALYICVELCDSVAAGASLEDYRVAFGHWSLALVCCGYVLFLDLWSYDVVSLRLCIEAWFLCTGIWFLARGLGDWASGAIL
jgi:hypothetical protein